MTYCKTLGQGMAVALLLFAGGSVHAVSTTYNYLITGDVMFDGGSAFGLSDGDTITAYGIFTVDSSYATIGGPVSFEQGTGNTMTINLNNTLLYASDDSSYAAGGSVGPSLTFTSGWALFDFDYLKTSAPQFNSSFLQFDNLGGSSLVGEWRTQTSVTAVPEASTYGMMLAGLGLVGFMAARRKSL